MSPVTRVLVTAVGGRSVGHQVLRALLHEPDQYEVYAADCDAFSAGLYQASHSTLLPRADSEDYLPSISRLVERNGIQVVIPGTESELRVLAHAQQEANLSGALLLASPAAVVDLCLDKRSLDAWLKENGFDSPATAPAESASISALGLPLIAKPFLNSGGSRDVSLVLTEAEADAWLHDNRDRADEFVFQQYVGDADSEFTVGVMISKDQEVIDSIVIRRKLHGLSLGSRRVHEGMAYTTSTGYSQGYIVDEPRVQEVCEELARSVGALGPLNVQCRLVGESVMIFEVHPRFSGTTSIRASAGLNEVHLLIQNFLYGAEVERVDFDRDVAAIRYFDHVLVPLSEYLGQP